LFDSVSAATRPHICGRALKAYKPDLDIADERAVYELLGTDVEANRIYRSSPFSHRSRNSRSLSDSGARIVPDAEAAPLFC
jgi:hypothetical protein